METKEKIAISIDKNLIKKFGNENRSNLINSILKNHFLELSEKEKQEKKIIENLTEMVILQNGRIEKIENSFNLFLNSFNRENENLENEIVEKINTQLKTNFKNILDNETQIKDSLNNEIYEKIANLNKSNLNFNENIENFRKEVEFKFYLIVALCVLILIFLIFKI